MVPVRRWVSIRATGLRRVAQALRDPADPLRGLGREPVRGVEREGHGRLADAGLARDIGDARSLGPRLHRRSTPCASRGLGTALPISGQTGLANRFTRLYGWHSVTVNDRCGRAERSADRSYHRPAVTEQLEPVTTPDEPPSTARPTDGTRPRMPLGIRLFLAYGALILVGIALSMRTVVDQAATMPISPIGVVVMILLAYTIFTMTLVIQRKQAGFGLALVLASLDDPRRVAPGHQPGASGDTVLPRGLRPAAVPRAPAAGGPYVPVRGVNTGIRARDT